jgi:hypothetical protein
MNTLISRINVLKQELEQLNEEINQQPRYSLRQPKQKNIVYFNNTFLFDEKYRDTTWFEQKINMLIFTNGRKFSQPAIDMVYESNAMQIINEHSNIKFVLYFDGKQVYVADCFLDKDTKDAIRKTGIKPDKTKRSVVLSCVKSNLKDDKYINLLNKSSVISIWPLSEFIRITKIINKYRTYFANVQQHFGAKIHEKTLEDDVLEIIYNNFANYNPELIKTIKNVKKCRVR